MKKTISLLLSVFLLLTFFSGCDNHTPSASIEEESQKVLDTNSSLPFSNVKDSDKDLTEEEIKAIISKVPSNEYLIYPSLHNIPLTATLYKNNEIISIDVNDTRIVKLMNLYNNLVYHGKYSYTQGLLTLEHLEENVINEEFRLELTFTPHKTEMLYDTGISLYDTIIVTNEWFVLIAHDLPGYEGMEDEYPYKSVGHCPLYADYNWLDLFDF